MQGFANKSNVVKASAQNKSIHKNKNLKHSKSFGETQKM